MTHSITLNPLETGSPSEVLSLLASMAKVTLTPEQEEASLAILKSLPSGGTIRDFIDACDAATASQLGISQEMFEAIRPLLHALESFATEGPYGHYFEGEATIGTNHNLDTPNSPIKEGFKKY